MPKTRTRAVNLAAEIEELQNAVDEAQDEMDEQREGEQGTETDDEVAFTADALNRLTHAMCLVARAIQATSQSPGR